jgi:hypothetical protein
MYLPLFGFHDSFLQLSPGRLCLVKKIAILDYIGIVEGIELVVEVFLQYNLGWLINARQGEGLSGMTEF